MGINVYISNKSIVSDFNALQLDRDRILQMSLSNPTADGMSTPTTGQPPLPPDAPPPLPTTASTQTTTASTPARTQFLYDDPTDPYAQFPVRRLTNDPSFSTPTSNPLSGSQFIHTSPPYRHPSSMYQLQPPGYQPLNFGFQSPPFSQNQRKVMKSPTEFILAGVRDRGVPMATSASTFTLSCDEFGQQYRSLLAAAAARRDELDNIFTACGMVYPFLPVDQDLNEFPLIFNNPITTSVSDKLWHQVDRVSRYFRNHEHQRDGAFRLDHLGELAYKDGQCDLYHKHAANLLESLRALDLLKAVTAMAARATLSWRSMTNPRHYQGRLWMSSWTTSSETHKS